MRIIADLHIHSRFSRGCSKDLTIDNLEKYARIKGVNLLGTGDFTHPEWMKELKEKLTEDEHGILRTKSGFPFILQTEISLIYTDGKGRRVHNVVLASSFKVAEQITEQLKKHGRVDYDGRPIFNISCPQFVKMLKGIDEKIEIIPAHIWTPHFSLFGEYNQFSTVEECFKDMTHHIYAMETGMSSDPAMNWRVKNLDRYTMVSFSDLHSYWPWRMAREATVFDIELTYDNLIKAIRTREGLVETIEFHPSHGKYHSTGHRKCDVCMEPKEAFENDYICPKCGSKLTVGVADRVEKLSDAELGRKSPTALPFRSLVPLSECISGVYGKGVNTKFVWNIYNSLIERFGNEYAILLNVPEDQLKEAMDTKLFNVLIRNRQGNIQVKSGYDGKYGVPQF